ncbi:hypothetical protein Nmel_002860, partial [Mimus melanotis]
MKGRCLCHSGWKGAECDVPTNQCIDVSCNNHGTCIMGTCICNPGYKGESCEEGILDLWTAWIPPAQDEACASEENVTVRLAGEEQTVRPQEPLVWISALVMGPSSQILDSAAAIPTGLATTAQ